VVSLGWNMSPRRPRLALCNSQQGYSPPGEGDIVSALLKKPAAGLRGGVGQILTRAK
jgi:hypothetical protein